LECSHSFSFILCDAAMLVLLSFPTRRSSDLFRRTTRAEGNALGSSMRWSQEALRAALTSRRRRSPVRGGPRAASPPPRTAPSPRDRKSTRLNSSHLGISYAVFCLKKKTETLV